MIPFALHPFFLPYPPSPLSSHLTRSYLLLPLPADAKLIYLGMCGVSLVYTLLYPVYKMILRMFLPPKPKKTRYIPPPLERIQVTHVCQAETKQLGSCTLQYTAVKTIHSA